MLKSVLSFLTVYGALAGVLLKVVLMKLNKVVIEGSESFAQYCFDRYALRDLQIKVQQVPEAAELLKWQLTEEQWRRQILLAISMIERD